MGSMDLISFHLTQAVQTLRTVYAFEAVTNRMLPELVVRSPVNRLYLLGMRRLSHQSFFTGPWIPHYDIHQTQVYHPAFWRFPNRTQAEEFMQHLIFEKADHYHAWKGFIMQREDGVYFNFKYPHYLWLHSKDATHQQLLTLVDLPSSTLNGIPKAQLAYECIYQWPWPWIIRKILQKAQFRGIDTADELGVWFTNDFTWTDEFPPLMGLPHKFLTAAVIQSFRDPHWEPTLSHIRSFAPLKELLFETHLLNQ
jgi:hypothetical protein